MLASDCPSCGPRQEVHHDAIWTAVASDFPGSAKQTYTGARVHPVLRRVPRTVETLCPECGAILLGRYFVRDGAVYIEKSCPDHGYFQNLLCTFLLLTAGKISQADKQDWEQDWPKQYRAEE